MQQRPQAVLIALVAVAVAIGALLLFAFVGRGPDTGTLTGPTWQLTAITGQDPAFQGVVPSDEQARYTITFAEGGTFAAQADCNRVSGGYELNGKDGITISPGPTTLVACPEGSYGSLFVHALSTAKSWAVVSGVLTLTTSNGGTGTFVEGSGTTPSPSEPASASPSEAPSESPSASPSESPSASPSPTATPIPSGSAEPTAAPTPTPAPTASPTPAPSAPPIPGGDLAGTSWQLTAITTREPVYAGVVPEADRSKYTVAFAADGTFSATADCNTVNGQWTVTAEGGLSIVPGPSTIVACAEGSLGDLYVLALTNSASYGVVDSGLTITLLDGGTLGYEPIPVS